MRINNRAEHRPVAPADQHQDLPEPETVPEPPAVRHRPSLTLTPVLVTAEIVVGAVIVARILARRPSVPRTRVTMGPGGWVSVKGGPVGVRSAGRPWGRARQVTGTTSSAEDPVWARLLSAVPLKTLSR
jgi:hypothetical protein